jgi:DNA-binding CsgD family transcriptional regulator
VIRTQEEHLAHYGILRRSGRYPWGSGSTQNARNRSFLEIISEQKKQGMTDTEIAKSHGITTTELRATKSIARAQQLQSKQLTAQRLKEKGWSNVAIGQRMGLNESSVRALLADGAKDKADALQTTANMLKGEVSKKKMVDVGAGVESELGITRTRLDNSVAVLKEEGYNVYPLKIQQIGTGKYTTMKVLAEPGITRDYMNRNRAEIQQIREKSDDHGRSWDGGIQTPISVNSRRIGINYRDEGGAENDGVIYVRPGKKDLSLGNNSYAQVRIAVDGTHFLKGMAVYKDDLPAGVDLVFNTNKARSEGKKGVMKELSSDPDFPFGAVVTQLHGPDGKVSSAMNIVNDEGTWDKWSRNLSSQMLSKQSPELAQQQLNLTQDRRRREYDEILSMANPTVKRDLLIKFADKTDAAAVHLKAAGLPRQATKVILPINSVKPDEIYAPSMRDGEKVALIRFPHGGKFEIPELTVNNRNREARRILGPQAKDAVGIHHTAAKRLSGADFDGDTVLVIPNNRRSVKNEPALEGLKDFDPQVYKVPEGSPIPRMTSSRKGHEMGRISNLITDMTIRGASNPELARAIRHSMVVIDGEKHHLDYRQSEKDNGIAALRQEYQPGSKKGRATTLISRARADVRVDERRERPPRRGGPIDPATGKRVYEPTGRMIPQRKRVKDPETGKFVYKDTGKMVPAKIVSKQLVETHDARTLDSGTVIEGIYAQHSNELKALANSARKESLQIKNIPYSPSAKKVYKNEVDSLNSKLSIAKRNAPRERQAQLLANAQVSQKRQQNPYMEKEEVKKVKQHALNTMRKRTGAEKDRIKFTQSEWDAIQAGAISGSKLSEILRNADAETVKRLAMPKETPKMTSTMQRRAQSMLASGFTQLEVADALGIGLTTLKVSLNE